MLTRLIAFSALLIPSLFAQDGGQLYTLYCGACHGANGEGASNGQFPPLAGSPWPVGDPDRAIKIVLGGLHGPVEVNGKTWNLDMPPQGAVLNDDQVAAILSYVRSSWGNKAAAVEASRVKSVRAATASRNEPWTAAALLKDHPLDIKPPIGDLISYVYDGDWQDIPDFTKLKPVAVEEEHNGLISLKKAGRTEHFGMVWQGTLDLPADGEYEFYLGTDDGGRIWIDDTLLVEITGRGPVSGREKQGSGSFKKGPRKLRVDYFEFNGQEEIQVAWKAKEDKTWRWLSDTVATGVLPGMEMLVEPSGKRPGIYRNFIKGASPRAIGMGLPGGVNFAWSADNFVPELIWTGKFMNATHHWTDRGQGFQPPAGERVVTLSQGKGLALASEARNGWPKETKLESKFRGYKFDSNGIPTFATQIGDGYLLDSFADGSPSGSSLVRTLKVNGSPDAFAVLLADSKDLTQAGRGKWTLPEKVTMEVKGGEPTLTGSTLILKPSPGSTVTITYTWN
jgi:mono/diheme cytochrome c family protein